MSNKGKKMDINSHIKEIHRYSLSQECELKEK